ncbi:hypothetical protein [Sphingomonas sp. LY160]|uniref:hypothetical protein n=1 Tax=Sphingomonas sp. LY160 TaxID=3095342 RepID=UPI002ADEE402|nr:hypothetical protein [Sphingomonas sp. LY160]MEA1072045.1 hypothetical protein [Sphingomonas sp. LY160]
MPTQWIAAHVARNLVINPPSESAEILALCVRAHAGLVRTRARLLIVGSVHTENTLIPPAFWWAEGHEALEQNWATGDFSTWIDQSVHWQAFGITFALNDVLEMLPVERRAIAARSLSVVGNPAWLNAKEARRFTYEKGGVNPVQAGQVLVDQSRLGFVQARATLAQRARGGQPDNWSSEEREWDIPEWFWENFTEKGTSSQDWERGLFAGKGRTPDGVCWITLTGVFFLVESLNTLLPRNAIEAPAAPAAPNPGGRPRKEWWDDLWCAVWGEVHRGELIPKTQADLERAMLAWTESRGESVSESTVKPLARKMFAEMNSDGKK